MASQAHFVKYPDFWKSERLLPFPWGIGVDLDTRNELFRSIASVAAKGIPIGCVKQLLQWSFFIQVVEEGALRRENCCNGDPMQAQTRPHFIISIGTSKFGDQNLGAEILFSEKNIFAKKSILAENPESAILASNSK